MLDHDFFERPAPKSLDRNEFDLGAVADCSLEDGAATLTAFTVETIAKAERLFPRPVSHWIVCGGGRKNGYLMEELTARLGIKMAVAEDCGWDGDSLEAQAFAFMAVRSLLRLPYSYPGTTGISRPLSGGVLFS
jgi:anhydro-N-acetylmuramic acid kinase